MGFVKTREEIDRIADALTNVHFDGGEYIGVNFESDADFIQSVLPPGLEPMGNNVVTAMICRFQGGCAGPFMGGAIYVAARHGDILGKYTLAMYMNSDDAMMFGRDLFGEPKKLAYVEFQADKGKGGGHVDRGGVRLIEIDAQFDQDASLDPLVDIDFDCKASFSADGRGLAGDAMLTVSELSLTPKVFRTGTASIKLNGNVHDPLHDIPVGRILEAQYIASDFSVKCRALAPVPAADFLPYAYGRYSDFSVLADTSLRGASRQAGESIANKLIGAGNAT